MEDILADKILELDKDELEKILRELKREDSDAFDKLKEITEDQL
jgi:hypothetical protein